MKVSIAKALSLKNRLAGRIADLDRKIVKYNRFVEGTTPEFDTKSLEATRRSLAQKLVEIKAEISRANTPVVEKIFMVSELKARIVFLKGLPCDQGTVAVKKWVGGQYSDVETVYKTSISAHDVENAIKEDEEALDKIQDELNHFNATTSIEISD